MVASSTAEDVGIANEFEPGLRRLSRDLANSARLLSDAQVKFLVDYYYQQQDARIAFNHQKRQALEGEEPNALFDWLSYQQETFENDIRRACGKYADAQPVGRWLQQIPGIGPVITAGILSLFDIRQAPNAGHFFRYAGLDPTSKWIGAEGARAVVKEHVPAGPLTAEAVIAAAQAAGRKPERLALLAATKLKVKPRDGDDEEEPEAPRTGPITRESLTKALSRRPWNSAAKRIMYLAGESFVKVQNNKNDVYGQLYVIRKRLEQERNERHDFSDQAAAALAEKRYGADTVARSFYEKGMLPPARIHLRATRWARKIFLADVHCVMTWQEYNRTPPRSYAVEHLGHSERFIPPFLEQHFPDLLEALKREGPVVEHNRAPGLSE